MTSRSEDGRAAGSAGAERRREAARERRRRAEVFGDVLPDATEDDKPEASDDGPAARDRDDWYRREVPPHHG